MPIVVVCGSCRTNLQAPDAAAGYRVRCPNCQALSPVPVMAKTVSDFEYVDPAKVAPTKPVAANPVVAAAVPLKAKSQPVLDAEDVTPKPKTKSKAIIDDDDEAPRSSKKKAIILDDAEDEEIDVPRRSKKKKPAKKKTNPLIFVLGGVGGLFALVFIGVMIWYVAVREKDSTAGTVPSQQTIPTLGGSGPVSPPVSTGLPAGWTRYEKPGFSVLMLDSLGTPKYDRENIGDDGESALLMALLEEKKKGMVAVMVSFPRATYQGLTAKSDAAYDQFETNDPTPIISRKPTTVDGQPGREVIRQGKDVVSYTRMIFAHGRYYSLAVMAPDRATAEELGKVFFESAKLNAATSPKPDVPTTPLAPVEPKAERPKLGSPPEGWKELKTPEFSCWIAKSVGRFNLNDEPSITKDAYSVTSFNGETKQRMDVRLMYTSPEQYAKAANDKETFYRRMEIANGIGGDIKTGGRIPFAIDGMTGQRSEYATQQGGKPVAGFLFTLFLDKYIIYFRVERIGLTDNDELYRTFVNSIRLK